MNRCKTCKHWQLEEDRYNNVLHPWDEEKGDDLTPEEVAQKFGHAVRYCTSPKIVFYEYPPHSDGAVVFDGSEYFAKLGTAQDFGCVLHEPISLAADDTDSK